MSRNRKNYASAFGLPGADNNRFNRFKVNSRGRAMVSLPKYTQTKPIMSSRKKRGYNWKARQQKPHSNGANEGVVSQVEGLSEMDAYSSVGHGVVDDSNALVLPSKRKKRDVSDSEPAQKRKRLSTKQRKRLQKIIEAKERKAQVRSK